MACRAQIESPRDEPSGSVQAQPADRAGRPALPRPQGRQVDVRRTSRTEVPAVISRLVDRFGRSGFAALTSLIWALPMAAWAGSSDLSPVDKTAYPRVAATIGGVMFVVWLILLAWLLRVHVTPRRHRFALAQMSPAE